MTKFFSIQNVSKNNAPINVHLTFDLPTTKLHIFLKKREDNQTKLIHIRTNKKIEITINLNNDLND
jgi:hypothetical protein